jgi:putative restriction endonuclease
VRGYVANTDYEWYRFLHAQGNLPEVNFWQPSGSRAFRAVEPGSPFFFKLKKPHYAVAGFGFFARHSILPAWLAWETFGLANGAADFATMRERIERLRDSPAGGSQGEYRIGCLMIAEPTFFDPSGWVKAPADFHRNIQQGATYDLTQGEGKRLWDECLSRARAGLVLAAGEDAPRYGAPATVRPRLGQGIFRIGVTDAYDRACAVTTEHSLPVLEAAHIRPYSEGGEHRVSNGLLLRSDIHRLFDRGYVTVTPDYRFLVSQRLKKDFDNGRTYFPFSGRPIGLPRATADRPDPNLLDWHSKEVFLG